MGSFFEKLKNRKRKPKTFMSRVMNQEKEPGVLVLMLEITGAVILDFFKLFGKILVALFLVAIISAAVLGSMVWSKMGPTIEEYYADAKYKVETSDNSTFRISSSSHIYDDSGNVLVKLRSDRDASYIDFEEIPEDLVNAFIAVEDRTFWTNPGIDLKGLIRVAVDFVKTQGDEMHGASTITQQLSRNVFLSHEVSLERKGKEMLISMLLTQKYSKEEIMEFYVNDICFGNAIYGIEAAARGYFNKDADELSLSQLVYLSALPNSPTYYDPYKHPERALERRNKILGDMLELEYITQEEHDAAIAEEIVIEKPKVEFNDYLSTYAIECSVEYLMKQDGFEFKCVFKNDEELNEYKKEYETAYGEAKDKLYKGGYEIHTSLNKETQKELQKILNDQLSVNQEKGDDGIYELQGAMTVVDNKTGKVVAIIGGRAQEQTQYVYTLNRAYQSPRQPGSSIKPLVAYTPALESGYTPDSIVKNIDVNKAKKPNVDIEELGGTRMTLRSALEQSKNGVAWYLLTKITPQVGLKYITDMNFEYIVPGDYNAAASLGGFHYGATTTEMAGAYAALSSHGVYKETTCLTKMIAPSGENIYKEDKEKQIYSTKAADTAIDMMKGVLTKGTASSLKWYNSTKVEAAAKTGTTNDNKDGWLCGSTPDYSIAVWVGYDSPKEMPSLWGNSYPGKIWKESMLYMIKDTKNMKFETDEEVSTQDPNKPDSYYSYMPGRDDSEVISPNYTVGHYRSDHVLGEEVDALIKEMKDLDTSRSDYLSVLKDKYNKALDVVEEIYGVTFTREKRQEVENAYQGLKNAHEEKLKKEEESILPPVVENPEPEPEQPSEPETPVEPTVPEEYHENQRVDNPDEIE